MPSFNQRLGITRLEADEYYRQALDHFSGNRIDPAMEALSRAIDLLPTNPEYHALRGLILLHDEAGDDAAEAAFKEALRLYSHEMAAHYGMGMIAYRHKQWDDAVKFFRQALFIDPQRAETLYYLALSHYHARDYANAVNYMGQAHQRFEAAGDKRAKSHSQQWLKLFEKGIVQQTQAAARAALPQQTTLPLTDGTS